MLAETLTGLGMIALLISYLPALYGAYSNREARLLTPQPSPARAWLVRTVVKEVAQSTAEAHARARNRRHQRAKATEASPLSP